MSISRISRTARRLRRNTAGAAAVEFALVIPVFLGLLFTSFEAGWLMLQSIMLDRAVDKTIRDLRIGTLPNPSQASVRSTICGKALVLVRCEESLALELITINSDADYPADDTPCIDRSAEIAPVLKFDPGGQSQTVFVRVCFVVNPITPMMGAGLRLPTDARGEYRLIAKSGFINEPA